MRWHFLACTTCVACMATIYGYLKLEVDPGRLGNLTHAMHEDVGFSIRCTSWVRSKTLPAITWVYELSWWCVNMYRPDAANRLKIHPDEVYLVQNIYFWTPFQSDKQCQRYYHWMRHVAVMLIHDEAALILCFGWWMYGIFLRSHTMSCHSRESIHSTLIVMFCNMITPNAMSHVLRWCKHIDRRDYYVFTLSPRWTVIRTS